MHGVHEKSGGCEMQLLSLARFRAIFSATLLATAFATKGAEWSIATVHSWSGRDVGRACDLALDTGDRPHISYICRKNSTPFDDSLYYAAWTGSAWALQPVYTNVAGTTTDTAISASGTTPTVSQIDSAYNYSYRSGVRKHTLAGTTWSNTQLNDIAIGAMAAIPSGVTYTAWPDRDHMPGPVNLWFNGVQVDGDALGGITTGSGADCAAYGATAGISYYSSAGGGVIKYAESSGGSWSTEVVAPMTGGSPNTGLTYDSDGNPHIIYTDSSALTSSNLGYAWRSGGHWQTQQLVSCYTADASIAFDARQRPNILFTSSGAVTHGVCNGTDWKYRGIGNGGLGYESAFAIDRQNRLHVAYHSGNWLKYALGEFVVSNSLLNGTFDSDSEGWNFGEIYGGEGAWLGAITQSDSPADPSNKVCEIHAHNYWGNSEYSVTLEQQIDVADPTQWLEFDYQFPAGFTELEVTLGTDWNDSYGVLATLAGPTSPAGEFFRCGIPLPFNRQDAKDASLWFRLIGSGPDDDCFALLDNIELVESGSLRLGKSATVLAAAAGQGASPPNATFKLWSTGTNDLAYSLSSDAAWLSLPGSSGTLTGQVETVEVEFDSAALAVGSYTGELAIAAEGIPSQTVAVVLSIVPPPVEITTTALPSGMVGNAYSFQLGATNGTPPYAWLSAIAGYTEDSSANSFAMAGTAQGWWDWNTTWQMELPFTFPFYGTGYTNCWIDSNGRVTFADVGSYDYPDEEVFTNTPMIAVLWGQLSLYDIYIEEVASAVTIRWKGGYVGGSSVNASLSLAEDGAITMKYGTGNAWGGGIGISAGDGTNYLFSTKHDSGSMAGAADILFVPWPVLPDGLALSTNGLVSGTPTAAFSNEVGFIVTDEAGGYDTEWFELVMAAGGGGDADGDGIPDWWETLYFGDPSSCIASNNADEDAHRNIEEYISGMNPTNSDSFFSVTNAAYEAGLGFVIYWQPVAGRHYGVAWATNLMTGGFQSLETNMAYPRGSYTDTVHSAEEVGFYRISVQLDE